MAGGQFALLVFNVLGGVAVLGSYAQGLLANPDNRTALWGGVPDSVRPLYGVAMLLAAAGYLAVASFLFFRREVADSTLSFGLGYGWLWVPFILILIPSALWMPLTFRYIEAGAGAAALWWSIRLVLILVALGALVLVILLAGLRPRPSTFHWAFALAGSVAFFLHVAVLDALLWPMLFRSGGGS